MPKVKFIDVGKKSELSTAVEKPKQAEKYYPSLFLDKFPPELMDKNIGDTCELEIIAVIKGKSMRDAENGKTESIDLEIRQIAYDNDADDKQGAEFKRQYKALTGTDKEQENESED